MTGFEAALLAWGVIVTTLLIVAVGCMDDLRNQLRHERALRALRAVHLRDLYPKD